MNGYGLLETLFFPWAYILKLDGLQKIAIALTVVGCVFDMVTTEILLQAGSVQVCGSIISFSEANPLFHVLGKQGFLAVYAVVSLMIIAVIVSLPKIVKRNTAPYQLGLLVLPTYGIAHLILGFQNFQIIQTYLLA